jgi:hypothetical protein
MAGKEATPMDTSRGDIETSVGAVPAPRTTTTSPRTAIDELGS